MGIQSEIKGEGNISIFEGIRSGVRHEGSKLTVGWAVLLDSRD